MIGDWEGELFVNEDGGVWKSRSWFLILNVFCDTLWANEWSWIEPLTFGWYNIILAFDELTETDDDVMLLPPFVDLEEDEEDFNEPSDVLLTA